MNQNIFKAYDVRGVYGTEFNEQDFHAIGRAFESSAGVAQSL